MNRLKKAVLLPIRSTAYRLRCLRLYYWADRQLFELQAVSVMPVWYYQALFKTCMCMLAFAKLHRIADRLIHTIPYHIRFQVA